MDRANKSDTIVEMTQEDVETQVFELNDLQLALVGGGCGDTILH